MNIILSVILLKKGYDTLQIRELKCLTISHYSGYVLNGLSWYWCIYMKGRYKKEKKHKDMITVLNENWSITSDS